MTDPSFRHRWTYGIVALGCVMTIPSGYVAAQAPTDTASEASEAETVYLPEGFPESFRFPEGSRLVSASGGQPPEYDTRSYNVDLETSVPVNDVIDFYTEWLAKSGFEILEIETGNATLIRFDTIGLDDASIMINDMYGDGITRISISLIMDPEQE